MNYSGFGGSGMTVGHIMAKSAISSGAGNVRRASNGWAYVQVTGSQGNGMHITCKPTGVAHHVSTYANGYPVARTKL
jgi:hypothetical protein